jgi:ribonuclease BN (tRNA processing enzyme)
MEVNLKSMKAITPEATSLDIQLLGAHSSESSTSKCMSILINERLAIDAGGLTSSLSFPQQNKLKAILLTHGHFDHIKDIPLLALNLFYQKRSLKVFCTADVRTTLEKHLLNGELYPRFQEIPPQEPTLVFELIKPYETLNIEGLAVTAIPANHVGHTVGYLLTCQANKSMFYTADTGIGSSDGWIRLCPDILIAEVTLPDAYRDFAVETKHLTPHLLEIELIDFREQNGYLPNVVVVHMCPALETQIAEELAVVSKELEHPIKMAYEGLRIVI